MDTDLLRTAHAVAELSPEQAESKLKDLKKYIDDGGKIDSDVLTEFNLLSSKVLTYQGPQYMKLFNP